MGPDRAALGSAAARAMATLAMPSCSESLRQWLRGAIMLGYQVNFKTEADPDHRDWHLRRWPNAEDALAFFNDNAAKKDGLGPFSFASISDFNPDYHLVGRRLPNGPEVESFFPYCVLPR